MGATSNPGGLSNKVTSLIFVAAILLYFGSHKQAPTPTPSPGPVVGVPDGVARFNRECDDYAAMFSVAADQVRSGALDSDVAVDKFFTENCKTAHTKEFVGMFLPLSQINQHPFQPAATEAALRAIAATYKR